VYGYLSGAVKIDSTDGGASAFNEAVEPAVEGDGELVITIANDRTVDAALEVVADYGAPAQTGDLPEAPEEE
jgi:CO dehydrogenase/acetyl-CoA synthase gamma subunit (corrinoid Fe-S protein)